METLAAGQLFEEFAPVNTASSCERIILVNEFSISFCTKESTQMINGFGPAEVGRESMSLQCISLLAHYTIYFAMRFLPYWAAATESGVSRWGSKMEPAVSVSVSAQNVCVCVLLTALLAGPDSYKAHRGQRYSLPLKTQVMGAFVRLHNVTIVG
jgi:hypothetical protein